MSVAVPHVSTARGFVQSSAGRVAIGTLVMIVTAQVAVPLPFTPVPITLQVFGMLLVAMTLRWTESALSLGLYLGIGALGGGVFAGGQGGAAILAPGSASGGYLWGMLAATAVISLVASRVPGRRGLLLGSVLGCLTVYIFGVAGLMFAVQAPLGAALSLGVLPFLLGDALKCLAVTTVAPLARRGISGH